MELDFVDESDVPFVVGKWVDAEMRKLGVFLKSPRTVDLLCLPDRYVLSHGMRQRADFLTHRCFDRSRVARTDSRVVGFAIVEPRDPCCHYLWVADDFRKQGIGSRLIADLTRGPWFYTHETVTGRGFLRNIADRISPGKFDPFYLDFIGQRPAEDH